MALRKTPLITDQVYHLFNRTINREPIFVTARDCKRALATLDFYRFQKPFVRLSSYLLWGVDKRQEFQKKLVKKQKLIEIIAFCLMPNHFHFLIRQMYDEGVSHFLGLFQNSYTRYFNTKKGRRGSIFQGQFKAVRVETDDQLTHLSRYIHLNPYSSYVVKNIKELGSYPWSSFRSYTGCQEDFCNPGLVMSLFDNDSVRYQKFVFNQADYQRNLEKIKHLIWE